jgi:hypothetical protein
MIGCKFCLHVPQNWGTCKDRESFLADRCADCIGDFGAGCEEMRETAVLGSLSTPLSYQQKYFIN